MNFTLFFILLGALAGISIWLGKKASGPSDQEGYFLMGRQLGLLPLTMTLLATQVGGGTLLGAAEEAYTHGWGVIFYPLGMVIGLLILGLGYGAKLRRLNLTTVAEIFEQIYCSRKLRKVASLISIASLYLILIGQAIAAKKFFFAVGIHGNLLFILFWLVLVLYTVMGGLKAVVTTDVLQASFILGAFGLALFATFSQPAESLAPLQTLSSTSPAPWFTWLALPLFFMLIEQDMGQRCFAAKKPRTVTFAALVSGLLLLAVSFAPIFFGRLAAIRGIEIAPGASVLISSIQGLTGPITTTIITCAILVAIVSTADSLLCSISSNIACDFSSKKRSIFLSQGITAFVGLSSLALSLCFSDIVAMLMFSYELAVSLLFVPVTMAVWLKKPSLRSASLAMILGGLGFLICRVWTPPFPKELFTLSGAFAGFFLSEWILKPSGEQLRV